MSDPAGPAPGAPLSPSSALGARDPSLSEFAPEEEPTTTGTLFLTMIILMIVGAFWVIVYLRLIDR